MTTNAPAAWRVQQRPAGKGRATTVRQTEFWARMDDALGPLYARTWAREHHMAELGDRTVAQALAEGEDAKTVWRAVWKTLELPAKDR